MAFKDIVYIYETFGFKYLDYSLWVIVIYERVKYAGYKGFMDHDAICYGVIIQKILSYYYTNIIKKILF